MMNFARKLFSKTIKSDSLSESSLSRTTNNISSDPSLRFFSCKELKAATRNFHHSTVLRKDDLVTAYKGSILHVSDSQRGRSIIVTIKKFYHQGELGFAEWQCEVKKLEGICHPNLEKLMGYGWNDKELFLVSEFMVRGSLDNHLFRINSPHTLSWYIRVKIMIGAARALAFLHSSEVNVMYGDFKSSYILLDEFYNSRLTDYGQHARTVPLVADQNAIHFTSHHGMDPIFPMTGRFTVKSDVYSFGVVLVEMLTGFQVVDSKDPICVTVAWMEEKTKELMKNIDPSMEGRYCVKSAAEIAQLALNCLQLDGRRRPTMQEVVEILEKLDTMPAV